MKQTKTKDFTKANCGKAATKANRLLRSLLKKLFCCEAFHQQRYRVSRRAFSRDVGLGNMTKSLCLLTGCLAGLCLLTACGGDDCVINNTVRVKAGFYLADGNACQLLDTLTVSVVRPQGDSVVLNRQVSATGFTLPLGFSAECDTFVLQTTHFGNDSLFIHHDNHPRLLSLDCGTTVFHTITHADCTHRFLQSVSVTKPEINYDALENLQIVFAD